MFQGLWPDVPVDEVPIGSITNGVHAHTWVSNEVDTLLRSSVGGMWDGADDGRPGSASTASTPARSGRRGAPGAPRSSRSCAGTSATRCSTRMR